MIKEKDYVHDYRKREKYLEYLEGIKRVLVIPSGNISSISTILQTVWGEFPGCHCFLLTGQFSQKYCTILPLEKITGFTQNEREPTELIIYLKNDQGFKLFGIEYALIRQLKKKKFDLAILIHENEEGFGYIHVELLALLSGAKHVLIFKPNQSLVRLHPFSFINAAIKRKIGFKRKNTGV
jgi:hypothetical protein